MYGKIWIESKVGLGSKFIFEIPLDKGDKTKIKKSKEINQNQITTLNGSHILLVEDNKINQEIIIGLLEDTGINIDIANNGKEAVEKFNINQYELILMDIQMPIMDGYEATKEIRKKNKDIPIIALTANAMKEDIESTKKAKMNEHLNKPIDVEKLYQILLKYISKKVDKKNEIKDIENIILPQFKYIDIKIGMLYMANNQKLYIKILNNFYKNYKGLSLDNLDDKNLEIVIHTIKGLSANLGAKELNIITEKIEETKDKLLFSKFYKELNNVIQDLELLPKSKEKRDKQFINENEKEKLFKKLKEALKIRKANQCNIIIKEIEKFQLKKDDEELFEKIKELIKRYRFKDILKLI